MATVIQQPDTLSLLGNLKSFRISSSVPVTFKLQKSGGRAVIIEESYTPDSSGIVEIELKGVIAQFLSTSLPSSDVFSQAGSFDTFAAYVDGALKDTFTVVRCGVRKIADTAENFLKANWLTWQPQTKLVRWNQPEYLTCYHVVAGNVKAKFYPTAGSSETVTVAAASAGTCKSYNMQLSHLFSLSSHDADELNGIVDVWVETTGGTRLSYIQRYVFTPETRNEHYFLCANSLGGVDTFCFTGDQALSPGLSHEIAELSDAKLDVSAELARSWSQNTGPFGPLEAKWIWEFFSAAQRWAVVDDNIEPIVLDSSSIRASDNANLNSCDFTFSLSEEGTLLKIRRNTGQLPLITVPSPSGELFFLAPRVIDYPDANLSDALLLLVQSPFVQEWKKTSLGDLTDYITESIRLTSWGQLAHSHSNKAVIDLFSVDAETGKLLFDGAPVIAEGGDYETLTNLPMINGVVIKGNKLASDYGLVGPDMFELDDTTVPGKVFIKAKYDGFYSMGDIFVGAPDSGEDPHGTTVSWSQLVTSGTKIATITIDGIETDVYAPSGGGSLAHLSDVTLGALANYDVLFHNNGAWRNIPFTQLLNARNVTRENVEADISANWLFSGNACLDFNTYGAVRLYGSYVGGKYRLNLDATDGLWINGVKVTGGGSTVSWGSESGGGVPLTVDSVTKTLALKSALSSYLPLSGGTMTGNIIPNSTSVNLGSSAKPWGEIHALKWYPKASDTTHYIEYTTNGFLVHGNILVTGEVTSGE